MPVFTVTKPLGTTDAEFQAYADLLEEIGVDIVDAPRIPEPETNNRWLYVWQNRDQASRFAQELRRRTYDPSWQVHEFEPQQERRGPLAPIEIMVIPAPDGNIFRMLQTSLIRISEHFPNARLVGELSGQSAETRRVPDLFWSDPTRSDFERLYGPVWEQIALILSGLSIEQIERMGGYRFITPQGRTLHESAPSLAVVPGQR